MGIDGIEQLFRDADHARIDGPCQREVCDIHLFEIADRQKEVWVMSDDKVAATFHGQQEELKVETDAGETVRLFSGESPEPVKELPAEATHALTLTVHVATPEQHERMHLWMSSNAHSISQSGVPYTSVSSVYLDGLEPGVDEEEHTYYDDKTLDVVREAVGRAVFGRIGHTALEREMVSDIIREMQNAGILFRERRS